MLRFYTCLLAVLAAFPALAAVNDGRLNPLTLSGACNSVTVNLNISNVGTNPISALQVQHTLNGTPATTPFAFFVPVAPGQSIDVTLPVATWVRGLNTIQVVVTEVNGLADGDPTNNTQSGSYNLAAVMGPTRIGGAGADFATLADGMAARQVLAAAKYPFGTCANQYWLLEQGNYTGLRTFDSTMNYVTFAPANGQRGSVRFTHPVGGDATINYAVQLFHSSNINFEKVTIERSASATANFSNCVLLTGRVRSSRFDSVTFSAPRTTTASGTSRVHVYSAGTARLRDISFNGCEFLGNAAGAYLDGGGNTIPTYSNANISFANNRVLTHWLGLFVLHTDTVALINNYISRFDTTLTSEYFGISLRWVNNLTEVSNNTIYAYNGDWGLRLRHVRGAVGNGRIFNNMIQVGRNVASDRALALDDTGINNLTIVHNNLNVVSSTTQARAVYVTHPMQNVVFQANNLAASSTIALEQLAAASPGLQNFAYNNVYTPIPALGRIGGIDQNSIIDLVTALGNGATGTNVSLDPQYVRDMDLHVRNFSLKVAPRYPNILGDIDGDLRDATTFIGADEAQPNSVKASLPASLVRLSPNPASNSVQVTLERSGTWQAEVLDLQGRTLRHRAGDGATQTLDLQGLATGLYLVRVTQDNASAVLKLVVE